jgi:hypothetical protein
MAAAKEPHLGHPKVTVIPLICVKHQRRASQCAVPLRCGPIFLTATSLERAMLLLDQRCSGANALSRLTDVS